MPSPKKSARARAAAPPASASPEAPQDAVAEPVDEPVDEPVAEERAPSEPPPEAPDRVSVKRTPMRPAGTIRDTNREIAIGLLSGLLCFSGGLAVVRWAFLSWMARGGSSTVLALSVLVPVALPIVAGSILGERGRKALGYAMISGVALGSMIGGMYFILRMQTPAALQPGPGPIVLPR